ncbi:hypothetical protein EVAR_29531_1 [Eumeta japonica]|uniref:Uncharacterized protein n=1 Tax=Eumeta variegata TaxID=151549 RepID=A0A4C1WEZ1_EUMVA|nr:hypothetical protein EVAR_29531_1 [Eumeta japonica]
MQEVRSAISSLTSAVGACNGRISDLVIRVESIALELNERDQDMICNDLEIAGILEEKNESSVYLILSVATKLGVSLDERYVDSIERVNMTRRTNTRDSERP